MFSNWKNRDPILLTSMLNMKLRDESGDLNSLCRRYDIPCNELTEHLKNLAYYYHSKTNNFNQIPN